jgi:quercetin dioxygenase-like cupin family protein
MNRIVVAALAVLCPLASASADVLPSKNATVTQVYDHPLPDVPGKSMRGVLVEYGPGGYSPSHTHARSAIIYATVLEGAVKIQIKGGQVHTDEIDKWPMRPCGEEGVSAGSRLVIRA